MSKSSGTTPVTATDIARVLAERHFWRNDFFMTNVKNGPTDGINLRVLDAVAIARSWAHPCITGYEIKISRGDFLRDQKWHDYLPLCNLFYFAAPLGVLDVSELPAGVGFIEVNHTGIRKVHRKAVRREPDRDALSTMMRYIIFSRIEPDRHPFFTNQSLWGQAFLEGRDMDQKAGHLLAQKISDLRRAAQDHKWEVEGAEAMRKERHAAWELLQKAGVITYGDSVLDGIQRLLAARAGSFRLADIAKAVEEIQKHVDAIQTSIGEKKGDKEDEQ